MAGSKGATAQAEVDYDMIAKELDSGPEVDARRDAAMRRLLMTPHAPIKSAAPSGMPRGRPRKVN
jgi:hypothetical protein